MKKLTLALVLGSALAVTGCFDKEEAAQKVDAAKQAATSMVSEAKGAATNAVADVKDAVKQASTEV